MTVAHVESALHDAIAIRKADRDLLSLALIDSRNHLLQLLAQSKGAREAKRIAARAGWFQEHWISRNVQRQRGEQADPQGLRLASIEPRIEQWCSPEGDAAPDELRSYLQDSLETTLDLLAGATDHDSAALYFYRLSLQHEDRLCEALLRRSGVSAPPARQQRPALWMPAQRVMLGSEESTGLTPHNERWAHEIKVPEFEIDAQAVNWSQYAEFVQDAGYDRPELWCDEGWRWVQQQQRRAPLFVEQMQGGVLVRRGGALQRAAAGQPVLHVSRFEAHAWCQWAGRRLPTEPEWEVAACTARSRGFHWGDVFEWVAGTPRAWPQPGPVPAGDLQPLPVTTPGAGGTWGVLRGASFATQVRWRHPKARRFAPACSDSLFAGFRSCAN